MTTWTPKKLLEWMSEYFGENNIDSPRLCAEMLLADVLQMQRMELYINFDKEVAQDKLLVLRSLVKRAVAHEPVSYLIGKSQFYSMEFEVDKHTLIPRPETEMLVEKAIDNLRSRRGKQRVLDLCTGSGCIASAIAASCPECKIIASDICENALAIAEKNIEKHNLTEQIHLLCGDLYEPIVAQLDGEKFDVIATNPPYVTTSEYAALDKNVKDFEPKQALVAGIDGLDIYKRIIDRIGEFLKDDGILLMEIGYRQGDAIRELLEESGCFEEIKIEKDFCNNDRLVTAYRIATEKSEGELFEEIKPEPLKE